MIRVINAELKNDYKIYVEFNNGTKGTIDFKKILEEDHREIIKELLNKELFKTVKVNLNTLCWDNEVDFAPDYLYEQLEAKEKAA
ncbi:MAG: DUF2442 domain-containing protein [Treponema sp.]|nr:DUF2442 domain-containing protein [Treponema sp.]